MAGRPLHPFNNAAKSQGFDPFNTGTHTYGKEIAEEDFLLKSRSDHPAVLGVFGLLPVNSRNGGTVACRENRNGGTVAHRTLQWVFDNWNWPTTWGWDYGMTAMAAARLGEPQKAVDALMMDVQKNTYLPNGHNYQDGRLRLYLPGNGALLTAIAMMCAGWEGCMLPYNPGFPQDGTWNVRWEGLRRMQ